jgi:hypothetical protein
MNCKPDPAPRFAVNRSKIISRLPGVQLTPGEKRFGSGRPRLEAEDGVSFPVPVRTGSDSLHGGWTRR